MVGYPVYQLETGLLEVRLLGQFEVHQDSQALTIPTRNAQSLFAYLILNAGRAHRREKLAGLLWPDSSEENARSNLRHELWRLRKTFEAGGQTYFLVDGLTIAFAPTNGYELDVHRLESPNVEDSTAEVLAVALSGYRGELLPGFYEEWVAAERERLQVCFETRIARLLELLQEQARWPETQEWATRWIALSTWPEPAYRALMTAYAGSGDPAKAVAAYERLKQGLMKELGVKPSPQTEALLKSLKVGEKPAVRGQSSQPVATPAMAPMPGWHRIRRSNLPRPLTSFIGRQREIQQVEDLLSSARLVTITGSGGVGKTRLAIQVAGALAPQFRNGIWWVGLGSLSATSASQKHPHISPPEQDDVDLVAQAVAKSVRVPETPGLPLIDGIAAHLSGQQLLLVLDNCEHLITACAALAESLLSECPDLSIMATSREALGVPGERAWSLPALSLPDKTLSPEINNIFHSEAVTLFVERAAGVLPGYQPGEADVAAIAQICTCLDGIPLALELAAARINLLSAQEIAARLDRRFQLLTGGQRMALPHHQTLLAAIEWSYDLLSEVEKFLFRRLSVFTDSFTLEAAETVCAGETIHCEEVLTLLGRLINKSLLQVDPSRQPGPELATRYRFLDSVHSLGRLKLEEAGEFSTLRDRHMAYYVHLVETAEPELLLQNQGFWYRLLLAETDNIRAVIEWSSESEQAEKALRIMGALIWFWWSHASAREGLDLAFKALALPATSALDTYRARTLNTTGLLSWILGDLQQARQSLEEALSILRASDDTISLAWSLQFMGLLLTSEREYQLADEAIQEGISIARQLNDLNQGSFFSHFVGDIAWQQGDRFKARAYYQEAARLLRTSGNYLFLAYPIRRLGYLALDENDVSHARLCFLESLELNQRGGDKRGVLASLIGLAVLALRQGQTALAARLTGAVESQLEVLSINLFYMDQAELGRVRSQLHDQLSEAKYSTAYNEGWEMNEAQALELVSAWLERQEGALPE